jgi:hypothetical protein
VHKQVSESDPADSVDNADAGKARVTAPVKYIAKERGRSYATRCIKVKQASESDTADSDDNAQAGKSHVAPPVMCISKAKAKDRGPFIANNAEAKRTNNASPSIQSQHTSALKYTEVTQLNELQKVAQANLDTAAKRIAQALLDPLSRAGDERVKAAWIQADLLAKEAPATIVKSFPLGVGGSSMYWRAKSITRLSPAHRFATEKWLCDETMNLYMLLLSYKYSHCLFMTSFSLEVMYKMTQRKFGDLSNYEYIFVPVNVGNFHWFMIVVDVKEKRIQCYDSFDALRMSYLETLLKGLQRVFPKADWNGWTLWEVQIYNSTGALVTPRQSNLYDCGVLTCMTAEFTACGLPLLFSQGCAENFRKKITLDLLTFGD